MLTLTITLTLLHVAGASSSFHGFELDEACHEANGGQDTSPQPSASHCQHGTELIHQTGLKSLTHSQARLLSKGLTLPNLRKAYDMGITVPSAPTPSALSLTYGYVTIDEI